VCHLAPYLRNSVEATTRVQRSLFLTPTDDIYVKAYNYRAIEGSLKRCINLLYLQEKHIRIIRLFSCSQTQKASFYLRFWLNGKDIKTLTADQLPCTMQVGATKAMRMRDWRK
jgi:hypothetical protein